MEEEHRGIALVILGIIAIIAVIGLVLLFTGPKKSAGMIFTSATGGTYVCPMATAVGEPQWLPVLAGPYENERFLQQWINAGFECVPAAGATQFDEYSYSTWCCRNPAGVPVSERGPTSLDTRRGFGTPVGTQFPEGYQYAAQQTRPPRVGP
jgi:hypothetical protein